MLTASVNFSCVPVGAMSSCGRSRHGGVFAVLCLQRLNCETFETRETRDSVRNSATDNKLSLLDELVLAATVAFD